MGGPWSKGMLVSELFLLEGGYSELLESRSLIAYGPSFISAAKEASLPDS